VQDGTDCLCLPPNVRNPTTLKCEAACPTGFRSLNGELCSKISADSGAPAIQFDFSLNGPWHSIGTDKRPIAQYCRPPIPIPDRGLYFNGQASLEITHFYLHSTHTLALWAKHTKSDATLLTYEAKMWEGWNEYDRHVSARHFYKYFEHIRTNNLITTE
jgi:hypothetical protein